MHLHSMGVCSPCIGEGRNLLSWNQQSNSFPDAWHSMVTTYSHKTNIWSKLMYHQLWFVSYLIFCLLIYQKNLPCTSGFRFVSYLIFLSIDISKTSPLRFQCFGKLSSSLCDFNNYQHLCLTDLCPNKPHHRYQFLQNFYRGLDISVVRLTYSPGNNRGNLHPLLPQYHTSAMRNPFYQNMVVCLLVSSLQCYDRSTKISLVIAVIDLTEAEIDERVQLILDMEPEDPNTVTDLGCLNSSTQTG